MSAFPGEFEQMVLMALLRLWDNAYGITIRDEIERHTDRVISIGAVCTTPGRMGKKGYVSCRIGAPTSERGGRRKKYYKLETSGGQALHLSYEALKKMISRLEGELGALQG